MDLQGKTILILGGSGLVGHAVARRLLTLQPGKLVLVGLFENELRAEAAALAPHAGTATIEYEWGNAFLPTEVAKLSRAEMLTNEDHRRLVLNDLLDGLSPDVLKRSFLYSLFSRFRPHAVVDCINTATAFAYQDVFASSRKLAQAARQGTVSVELVEEHLLSIPMPQLIRHVQIMLEAVRTHSTGVYVKIGTSGTGGMGLNLPYTHSEERPSRTLLTKSALAGAHSLLLFLVARTPDAPATAEIKPTAAIAWREIAYGPIRRWGSDIQRYDCPTPLSVDTAFTDEASGWVDTGEVLRSVYADVGENGYFARDEFETVTSLGQMEFITPEEVADYVVLEMQGHPTGRNVVAALDAATAGPTYKAGALRAKAIERLEQLEKEHGVRAVAFEMLGPPRLSKLLYEAFIMGRVCASVHALSESDPSSLAEDARALIAQDEELRGTILSVGLPIILDRDEVYRGEVIIVPVANGDMDRAIQAGWVDLRVSNCETWVGRAQQMVEQAAHLEAGTGSGVEWDAILPDAAITPPYVAKWIFRNEEGGERIKR